MPQVLKRILIAIGVLLLLLVLVVGGYLIYLTATYYRIPDNQTIEVSNNAQATMQVGKEYTAATYNIGFGAYTPDYTFFMDEGIMKDGTKTVGKRSTAVSKESVEKCTKGSVDLIKSLNADFILLQEVDTTSTRSFQVNQKDAFADGFPSFGNAYASNFHTGFLAYPIMEPHGIANAGVMTLSDVYVDDAYRRSYPIDESFPTKFFDCDRCFLIERIPVDNGKELVLINNHMSAYDEGGKIRAQQFDMLVDVIEDEYEKGNYVVIGGDWNHALCGSEAMYPSAQQVPPWISTFDESDLPRGFKVVRADNIEQVASCRGDDIPYEKGYTYTATVDGFVVSANVDAKAKNIDGEFKYSDHNPVTLAFTLRQ